MRKSRFYKTGSKKCGYSVGRKNKHDHPAFRIKCFKILPLPGHILLEHDYFAREMARMHKDIIAAFTCPLCEAGVPVVKKTFTALDANRTVGVWQEVH